MPVGFCAARARRRGRRRLREVRRHPIYKPGYGTMGKEPVTDGPAFTVGVVWHTWRQTRDEALRKECLPVLVRAMNYLPRNPANGLVHIARPRERCPYGFTDSIPKSGDQLFDSLLAVQAYRQLASWPTTPSTARRRTASPTAYAPYSGTSRRDFSSPPPATAVRPTSGARRSRCTWMSRPASSRWRSPGTSATTMARLCRPARCGICPGSWTGRAGRRRPTAATTSPARTGARRWAGCLHARPGGPETADQTVVEMVRFYQQHGTCEWINGDKRKYPGYLASAALAAGRDRGDAGATGIE